MVKHNPRVSIGLPVHNGEKYLAEAIQSMLNQTFGDFELIISDNASTDGTAAICEYFQASDSRVRYFRSDRNAGAAPNFNRTVSFARGEYFKWLACDDVCRPEFLDRCVAVLDGAPDVLWCCPRTTFIDESGRWITNPTPKVHSYAAGDCDMTTDWATGAVLVRHPAGRESARAHERFAAVLHDPWGSFDYYGLIRMEGLRRTGLERPFIGSDKVLVAEWSLMGRFAEVPETLQLWRSRPGALGLRSDLTAKRIQSGKWNKRFFLPRRIACTYWYARLVLKSKLPAYERFRCFMTLGHCICQPWRWRQLVCEPFGWRKPLADARRQIAVKHKMDPARITARPESGRLGTGIGNMLTVANVCRDGGAAQGQPAAAAIPNTNRSSARGHIVKG